MVYIKEIRMTGWKSYGSGTVTMPLAKGFTVIVGPNGSGKSNSIDAVQFCLGTLSKKTIRADKMINLIYNGIGGKKPADKATVEIVFDNSDYAIPIREKEIIVSRELKRNGSGTYRLNKKRTTRNDILDKLRIAGIDVINSYNIIAQGQVGQIVGMNPVERRLLLEDLAGVGQFKDKKESALKELETAQTRMNELQLLVNEVSKRVESLRKEKNDAERWMELDKEVQDYKTVLTSFLMYDNMKTLKESDDKIFKIREDQESFLKEKEDVEENIQETAVKVREIEDKLIELETQLREIRGNLEEKSIEKAKIEQKIHYNEKTIESNNKRIKEQDARKKTVIQKAEEDNSTLEKAKDSARELLKKIEESQAEREEIEEELSTKREEHDNIMEEFRGVEREERMASDRLTRAQVQFEVSSNMVTAFENNVNERQRRIDESISQAKKAKELIAQFESDLLKETNDLTNLNTSIEEVGTKKTEYESSIESLSEKLDIINNDYLTLKSRIETISSFLSAEEGRDNPAVSFISHEKISGVIGEFQNVGKVPTELGNLSDAIITDTIETSVKCIKLLKDSAIGTANFIPLEIMSLNKDSEVNSIIENVRSMNRVVTSIEEAAKAWKDSKQSITTTDGDVFQPNGVIYGGFHLLSAKENIAQLEDDLKEKKGTLDQIRTELSETKSNLKKISKSEKQLERDLKAAETNLERTKLKLTQQTELMQGHDENLQKLETDIVPLQKQLAERLHTRDNGLNEIKEYETELSKVAEGKSEIQQRLNEAAVEPILERLNRVEKTLGKFQGQLQGTQSKIEALINSGSEKDQRVTDINQEISNIEVENANLSGEIEAIKEQEVTLGEQLEKLRAEEKEFSSGIKNHKNDLEAQNKYRNTLIKDKDSLVQKVSKFEEKITEIKLQRERFAVEIDKLKLDIEENNIEIIPEEDERLKKVDKPKISREINKREEEKVSLEPVNMKALKEFQGENARYMELMDRRELLLEERQIILDFIEQIETEKLNIFMKTYRAINKHFGTIFFELSNGKARLILEKDPTKGEDVFEGGVFIEAHPAGKKVASIESMSGGEKALTALAFIFAVQTVDAQPFYILDEIDAALDPMNVRRVAKLLHRMSRTVGADDTTDQSSKAQFLVISHRDILMAWADRLYGCTNVKGLSSMFSIKLSEDKQLEHSGQFT